MRDFRHVYASAKTILAGVDIRRLCSQVVCSWMEVFRFYQTCVNDIFKTINRFWCQLA